MRFAARKEAIDRLQALQAASPQQAEIRGGSPVLPCSTRQAVSRLRGIELLIRQAGWRLNPGLFIIWSLACGIAAAWLSAKVLAPAFVPLFALAGAVVPLLICEQQAGRRAAEFAADYPSVLLACASTIKAGMTALAALERAGRLLPPNSLVRRETEQLLKALSGGCSREQALREFGAGIRLPDLELFRTAFVLVMENGGRFAPTLERLARVCRDRTTLIHAARVSTATMRMTAGVLLVVAPLIVLMIAVRTEDFWPLLLHHPVANLLASIGIVTISISVGALYRMSRFRP